MINGELIDLHAGRYQARIATCGATLVHLRRDGRDLVVPFDAESTLPAGWQGKTLMPWPNRITGASYTYGGQTYQVACNEPETGAALHGMVGWMDWQVAEVADSALTLGLNLPASYGYPWSLELAVRFTLDADSGLKTTATATCVGAAQPATNTPGAADRDGRLLPAPCGIAFHPYLTRSVPLDQCELTAPAPQVLEADENLAPLGLREVEGSDWDWRAGRLVGASTSDNTYTGMPEGTWEVRLSGGEHGGAVVLASDAPWVHLYTAEHLLRRGVAVEPMTCPPNAFSTGQDLVALEIGQSHALSYFLREDD